MKPVRSGIDRHARGQHIRARTPADPVRSVKNGHLRPRDGLAGRNEFIDAFPDGDRSGQAGNAGANNDDMCTHGQEFGGEEGFAQGPTAWKRPGQARCTHRRPYSIVKQPRASNFDPHPEEPRRSPSGRRRGVRRMWPNITACSIAVRRTASLRSPVAVRRTACALALARSRSKNGVASLAYGPRPSRRCFALRATQASSG